MPAIGDMVLTLSEADDTRTVRMTREEVRTLIGSVEGYDDLITALDYAQGNVAKGPQHVLIRVVDA